jgi:hypothetical protein
MTNKFDKFIKSILREDLSVSGVLGNDGAYDTSDARIPKILGSKSRKRRKRRKSS